MGGTGERVTQPGNEGDMRAGVRPKEGRFWNEEGDTQ